MAKQYGYDINEVIHQVNLARNGRSKSARTRAKNMLAVMLKKEANRANARMRALERAGLDYGQAYDSAVTYLANKARKRFSAHFVAIDAAYIEYLRIHAFLQSGQSTVSGQKKINQTCHMRRNTLHALTRGISV